MERRIRFPGRMSQVAIVSRGPTALAAHLEQGHVLAIVLLSLLCVRAVDEGTAFLRVAIT